MRNAIESLESRRLLAGTVAMYTYAGDANLDGVITGDDYGTIDSAVLVPGADGYYNGDFNYDGVVNGDDYGIIDFNGGSLGGVAPVNTTDFAGTRKNDVIVVSALPGNPGAVVVNVNGKSTATSAGKLKLSGNGGNDKIHIDLPDSYASWLITIFGGGGNDVIVGSMAAERIIAGDGNDYVLGNGGRDTVYAEAGDDSVRGGGSSDLLDGGAGNDTVRGDAGNDRISGGDGFDRLRGSVGNDTLDGGASKDFIGGEVGDDQLNGAGGADVVAGGEDDDVVIGGAGDDNVTGDAGDDFLSGGSGFDQLFGGGGNDGFDPGEDAAEARDLEAADIEPGLTSITIGNSVAISGPDGLTKTSTGRLILTGANTYSGQSVLASGAKLDLKDNKLVVNDVIGSNTGANGIQGLVQRGANATWGGSGLVTSAPQAATGISSATAGQALGLASNDTALWQGQTITGDSVLVMYTYMGDINFDGVVDAADYG